jgi:hypothetical protein
MSSESRKLERTVTRARAERMGQERSLALHAVATLMQAPFRLRWKFAMNLISGGSRPLRWAMRFGAAAGLVLALRGLVSFILAMGGAGA